MKNYLFIFVFFNKYFCPGKTCNGDLEIEKGDMTKAMMEYSAAEQLIPDNMEMKFWKAVRWQAM